MLSQHLTSSVFSSSAVWYIVGCIRILPLTYHRTGPVPCFFDHSVFSFLFYYCSLGFSNSFIQIFKNWGRKERRGLTITVLHQWCKALIYSMVLKIQHLCSTQVMIEFFCVPVRFSPIVDWRQCQILTILIPRYFYSLYDTFFSFYSNN